MVDDPMMILTPDQSWDLLSGSTFGRLAVSISGQPDIFPINIYADDGTILFRTAEGTKLAEIAVNDRVAFETDGYTEHVGWSVVAKGHARVLTSLREIEAAEKTPLRPWIPTLKYNFVKIEVDDITGRRYDLGPEPDRY